MVVYVELAFLENFCLDFLLLVLTAFAAKASPRVGGVCFAAALGGGFAVLLPLLALPNPLRTLLKFAVGGLLPLSAVGKQKWGLGVLLFFLLTFAFGGALLSGAQSAPAWVRFPLFAALALLAVFLVKRLYRRRDIFTYIYDCVACVGEKKVKARGFLDSGNCASKEGVPVCFLAADLLYDLVGGEMLLREEGVGQGCDEMQIFTQAGAKIIPLYRGKIEVKGKEILQREVYFARAANRIGREYKILLNSRIGI